MNNKGKMSPLIVVFAVLLLVGIGWLIYGQTQQSQQSTAIEQQSLKATGDCENAPTLTTSLLNAVNPGTEVAGATFYANVNGEYIGTVTNNTEYNYGDKVQILASVSNYIDEIINPFTVKCGINRQTEDLYATDTNTFRIFNTNGNLLTDSATGGATNQTASASPISLDVKIDSKTDQSSGDLVIVIESDNTTEVDDMVLSGNGAVKVDVPEFYSVAGAGSIARAYGVPALIDGETKSYTLTINPESGQTIGGGGLDNAIYVTAYSKQAFVDVDGSFKVGVENEDGTTKYEDTWDFDLVVGDGA